MPINLVDFATLPADEQIMKVMMIDPSPCSPAIAQLPAELYERYTVVRSAPTSSSS
jgi:hypothetical protein